MWGNRNLFHQRDNFPENASDILTVCISELAPYIHPSSFCQETLHGTPRVFLCICTPTAKAKKPRGWSPEARMPGPSNKPCQPGSGKRSRPEGKSCTMPAPLCPPRALRPKEVKWSKLAIKPARLALRLVWLDLRTKWLTLGTGFWPSSLSWAH